MRIGTAITTCTHRGTGRMEVSRSTPWKRCLSSRPGTWGSHTRRHTVPGRCSTSHARCTTSRTTVLTFDREPLRSCAAATTRPWLDVRDNTCSKACLQRARGENACKNLLWRCCCRLRGLLRGALCRSGRHLGALPVDDLRLQPFAHALHDDDDDATLASLKTIVHTSRCNFSLVSTCSN